MAELHATELSPNTIAKAYRVLSGVMDGAVDARLIARSPCTIKGAGTERHDEMQIATPEQVAALAAAVGPRWEALVFTAAYGGLRWGELAALRRCDIDLASETIAVTRKLADVNGQLSYGQHVIDGQDADIVRYLERFGDEPPVPIRAHDDTTTPVSSGHAVGTPADQEQITAEPQRRDQDFYGGDDRTRTGDPLLAKQVL